MFLTIVLNCCFLGGTPSSAVLLAIFESRPKHCLFPKPCQYPDQRPLIFVDHLTVVCLVGQLAMETSIVVVWQTQLANMQFDHQTLLAISTVGHFPRAIRFVASPTAQQNNSFTPPNWRLCSVEPNQPPNAGFL